MVGHSIVAVAQESLFITESYTEGFVSSGRDHIQR